jgi:hypothetical protein
MGPLACEGSGVRSDRNGSESKAWQDLERMRLQATVEVLQQSRITAPTESLDQAQRKRVVAWHFDYLGSLTGLVKAGKRFEVDEQRSRQGPAPVEQNRTSALAGPLV